MRIQGLVRIYRQIRNELRRGIPPDERVSFRDRVRDVVKEVERICEENDVTPEVLPGPSREAWRFLSGLDLEDLPAPTGEVPLVAPAARVSGVVAVTRSLALRMWREAARGVPAPTGFREEIVSHVEAIEDLCREQDSSPGALPPPSRHAFSFLRLLLLDRMLEEQLGTLAGVTKALVQRGQPLPPLFRFHPGRFLYKVDPRPRGRFVTASPGYIGAPPDVLDLLARISFAEEDEKATAGLRDYARGEPYRKILASLERLATPAAATAGRVRDLADSFERVCARYFNGNLPRPNLVWGEVPTRRRFGVARPDACRIVISPALDAPEVPERVLDFVLYHELLHLVLGIPEENGRQVAHGPEFRRRERRFEGFEEVRRFLAHFARDTPDRDFPEAQAPTLD